MLQIKFMSTYCDTALRWMLQNTSDDTMKLHVRYGVWFKALEKSYWDIESAMYLCYLVFVSNLGMC